MAGSPPPGNGLFDQLDIIAALNAGHYMTGPYSAIVLVGRTSDRQISMFHGASSGELAVDAPVGKQLASIGIESAAAKLRISPEETKIMQGVAYEELMAVPEPASLALHLLGLISCTWPRRSVAPRNARNSCR